jgi:hypothetical protein
MQKKSERIGDVMEETQKRRWLMVLFFGLIVSLFVGFMYLVFSGSLDKRYQQRLERAAADFKTQLKSRMPVDRINIFLPIGERVRIDNNVAVYQGLDNQTALIDVYISDLDPQTPYRHRIQKTETGKEIRLGGHNYLLQSIAAKKLKLKRIAN